MRVEVQSNSLDVILEKVREQHPFRRSECPTPSGTFIDEVREKLEECHKDGLQHLAYEFDVRKLLACVEIIAIDGEGAVAEKAAMVLRFRPREQTIIRGWLKLVRSYPLALLEKMLRDLISIKGFIPLEKDRRVSPKAPFWFVSKTVADGILNDYRKTPEASKLDDYLRNNLLDPEEGLYQEVWRQMLSNGKASDLRREKPTRFLDEFGKAVNAPYLAGFCQHYLNVLDGRRDWAEPILEFVNDEFGLPVDSKQRYRFDTKFWQGVADDAKAEFRKWLILREIETFFEGERADFWRFFVEATKVRNVQEILEGEGFMLEFDGFGVVEFKNVGNAAYMYPPTVFRSFWNNAQHWSKHASFFKERDRTLRIPYRAGWDGRILHFRGWQENARELILEILGER
jgi:hypothetical protein